MEHPYPPFPAIERALTEVILEAHVKGVRFQNTELVTTSEEWDHSLVVLFFYENEADVQKNGKNGTNEWIKEKFITELNAARASFSFSELPEIAFSFDSAENVEKNYQGNYFLRLR